MREGHRGAFTDTLHPQTPKAGLRLRRGQGPWGALAGAAAGEGSGTAGLAKRRSWIGPSHPKAALRATAEQRRRRRIQAAAGLDQEGGSWQTVCATGLACDVSRDVPAAPDAGGRAFPSPPGSSSV